ncbi:MAG: 23S rRNA (guanosine(2251)-2'-O)-methyltransferase RlmB [Marinilabiliales bacterium]|nr:23S rRNA (guanosine(2251)-2'-O)-methyltransferase RlmB [Marinilabiliales bacterium]
MEDKNFVFGFHSTIEAILSGKEIDRILLKKGLQGDLYLELTGLIREYNIPYQMVPGEKIDRITRKNHQGVIAFVSLISYQPIEEVVQRAFENGKVPMVLMLDRITDVRNFGAIARSAEVAGVDALVIPEKGAAQINADAIKTSSGALMSLPVCREKNLVQTARMLRNSGLKIVAATEKGATNHFDCDLKQPLVLLMGSEETGIDNALLRIADDLVKIPQFGTIQSLNVSVAAGVLIYEAIRQRFTLD